MGDRPVLKEEQTPQLRPGFPKIGAKRTRNCANHKANRAPSKVMECYAGVCCFVGCVNDPSAGSPTETLLRLLLPRNVQI